MAQAARLVEIVRDEHHGATETAVHIAQRLVHALLGGGVERRERLIKQQDLGLHHQCACQRRTLALTAADDARVPVGDVANGEQVEHLLHAACRLRLGNARHPQAVTDVLRNRHMREQRVILVNDSQPALLHGQAADVLAVEQDAAGLQGKRPGNRLEQHGLAGARLPHDGEYLVRLDMQFVNAQQEAAAARHHVANLDAAAAHRRPSHSSHAFMRLKPNPLPALPTRLAPVGRSSTFATTSVNAETSSMIMAVAIAVSVLPVEMLR